MLDYVIALIKREPLVVVGAVASVVVAVAGQLGIILNSADVQEVLLPLVVALVGRTWTVPANEVEEVADDDHRHRHHHR